MSHVHMTFGPLVELERIIQLPAKRALPQYGICNKDSGILRIQKMNQKPKTLQIPDRRFYARSKAFGRFGMRIFEPMIMDRPHWHGHVEANYVRHARMFYKIDGDPIIVEPDSLVIFWANVPHQLTKITSLTDDKPELSNIYLPLDVFLFMPHIQELQVNVLMGGIIVIPPDIFQWSSLKRWYEDYRTHQSERTEIIMMELNALFRRAALTPFHYLRAPWRDKDQKQELASVHVRHVVSMVRYILENIEKSVSNAEITAVTGLHENYALTLFSRTMLITPKQFIIRLRLLRARSLILESKSPISSIAMECGFNSMTQFYEHFSKAYGTKPQSLRKI
jgi:AraC family transcriptional regulator, melibiose operon regulatory protein